MSDIYSIPIYIGKLFKRMKLPICFVFHPVFRNLRKRHPSEEQLFDRKVSRNTETFSIFESGRRKTLNETTRCPQNLSIIPRFFLSRVPLVTKTVTSMTLNENVTNLLRCGLNQSSLLTVKTHE